MICYVNDKIQVIACYIVTFNDSGFVNIYETFHFKDWLLAISKYLDFSLKDLIWRHIYLTKLEIAFIINQVRYIWSSATYDLTQQVLISVQFIWLRKLNHQIISIRIFSSLKVRILKLIRSASSSNAIS